MKRTRFAPTPSGYLHLGNLASFLLTAGLAEVTGARRLLRIDDLDEVRTRKEYLEDIFDTLSFFQLHWDEGPRNRVEHQLAFSQLHRVPLYDKALEYLRGRGLLYACNCSRSELAPVSKVGGYPGYCRGKNLPLDSAGVAWRVKTEHEVGLDMHELINGRQLSKLPGEMKDFVVRKKDGQASYQLTSVVDDIHFGVDLIVRGADLRPSSLAQLYLSKLLPENSFQKAFFVHHPLLSLKGQQRKLSKSAGDTSIMQLRREGLDTVLIMERLSALVCGAPVELEPEGARNWLMKQWLQYGQ